MASAWNHLKVFFIVAPFYPPIHSYHVRYNITFDCCMARDDAPTHTCIHTPNTQKSKCGHAACNHHLNSSVSVRLYSVYFVNEPPYTRKSNVCFLWMNGFTFSLGDNWQMPVICLGFSPQCGGQMLKHLCLYVYTVFEEWKDMESWFQLCC